MSALGATHWNWRPDVEEVVSLVRRRFPNVTANTYRGHPWPGWDAQSVDFWGPGGRGHPINYDTGRKIVQFLWGLPGEPHIRHYIWLNTLWTSFGGKSHWASNDHSGSLRHVHVTYW